MRRHRNFFALTTFIALLGGPAGAGPDAATGWPGLRGPTYDGAARQARLFGTAPRGSLAVGWMKPLGSGYSGVTAEDGRVVTMFAAGDSDVAAAFDAATGNELWRYRIADAYKGHDGSHDGPISTPLMAGGRVFGLAPRGELFALDAATGKSIWTKNIVEAHDAVMPFYGFTTSPILVEGVLVVEIGAPEGRTIAGLHPDDGRLLWTAGNDSISFHSPIAATIGDRVLVVAAGRKTFLGLEPATGRALWSYEHNGDESAMGGETIIPVPAGNGRFFLLNKNDSSVMLQVVQTAKDSFEVKELWSKNSMRGTYAIPVYHDGYIYGMTGKIVTCVDAATGETKWKSREPGDGFPTLVGNHLLMITKPGTLHVAEASPAGYSELARLDLFGEHSWSAVAYLDGHIYARSMGHLARIDLTQDASSPKGGPTWVASTRFGRFLEDVGKAADKRAAVDAFLAGQKSLPIVEENGAVHFIYRGEATDVGIVGDMIGFRREDPMTRLEGTDLFHYSTRLEPDAALNYGFIVDYGKPIADPKNPNQGSGLWGEVSWLAMPAWNAPSFLSEAETARQGRLETLDFESTAHEGAKRSAQIYLPAGYDASGDRRFPTLYVHDGKEALERGQMKNALDQLIGRSVEPVIAVFIMPPAENPRADLFDLEKYTTMIVSDLIPKIDAKYRTIPEASERAAAGAAGGGNAALYGALKRPDVFMRVGSQAANVMSTAEYVEMLPGSDAVPLVIYLEWGTYHLRSPHEAWDMARGNRELWSMLRERGHRPAGGEVPEGFGWGCWRTHLDEMLSALFPMRQG